MRPHLGSPAFGIDGDAGAEDAGEVGEEGHGQAGNVADSIRTIKLPSGGGNSYRRSIVQKAGAIANKIGSDNPFIVRLTIVEEYLILTI